MDPSTLVRGGSDGDQPLLARLHVRACMRALPETAAVSARRSGVPGQCTGWWLLTRVVVRSCLHVAPPAFVNHVVRMVNTSKCVPIPDLFSATMAAARASADVDAEAALSARFVWAPLLSHTLLPCKR